MYTSRRMIQSETTIINIQIALLGVVVVCGFFYLWRLISRLEDRIERIQCSPSTCPMPMQMQMPMDEDIMESIFGSNHSVIVEEAEAEAVTEPEAEPEPEHDSESVPGLSKTKIRKMSVEALRELCKEHDLSPEGPRNQLMERAFSLVE